MLVYSLLSYFLKEKTEAAIELKMYILLLVFAIIFIVHFLFGTSGYGLQTEDHIKLNSVFNDLLNYDWPVLYFKDKHDAMLTYYIGQYIFPVFIAKLLSFNFQMLLFLNYCWVCLGFILISFFILLYLNVNESKKAFISLLLVF